MSNDTHGTHLTENRYLSIVLLNGDKWTGTVKATDAAGLYLVTDPGDQEVLLPWSSILVAKIR